MREIGVRELKSGLSEVLRDVDGGEQVRITVRGRPVADLVPLGSPRADAGLQALMSAGRITPPTAERPTEPPPRVRPSRSGSDLIAADRDAER